MERDERIGLRLSIALHVALLAAMETGSDPIEQNNQPVKATLVVLPAQSAKPNGEQRADATDDCRIKRRSRSTPVIKLEVKIAKAPLETALRDFGHETGLPYAIDARLLGYRWGSAVRGYYTPAEVADRLLIGTGLCSDWIAGGLVIERCDADDRKRRKKPSFGFVLAQSNPCGDNYAQTFNRSRIDLPGLK